MKPIIFLLAGLAVTILSKGQEPSAREIVVKSQQVTRLHGIESKTRLEIHDDKGNVRIRETTMASRIFEDGTEKRVIVFLAPADVKGTGMLIFDYPDKEDDMWLYMPALRKTRKIVSGEKSKSFMGSEFSNADLSVPYIDEFNYTLEGKESIEGTECWKIKQVPVSDKVKSEYGFAEKLAWIGTQDFVPRKAITSDDRGSKIKEISYSGIKKVDQKSKSYFITHMVVKNLVTHRFSIMDMQEFQYNPSINTSYFTQNFLESQ